MSINYTVDTGYGFVIPKTFFSNYRKIEKDGNEIFGFDDLGDYEDYEIAEKLLDGLVRLEAVMVGDFMGRDGSDVVVFVERTHESLRDEFGAQVIKPPMDTMLTAMEFTELYRAADIFGGGHDVGMILGFSVG